MTNEETSDRISILRPCVDADLSEKQLNDWQNLSEATSFALLKNNLNFFNRSIATRAKQPTSGELREVYAYWNGVGQINAGQIEVGIQSLNDALSYNADFGSICGAASIQRAALDRLTRTYIDAGKLDKAERAFSDHCDPNKPDASTILALAKAKEAMGEEAEAKKTYYQLARNEKPCSMITEAQVALRNIQRIDNREACYEYSRLIDDLSSALLCRDRGLLTDRISSSGFEVGLGCHGHYADHAQVIDRLCADLDVADISIVEIIKSEVSATIRTNGWRGEWFNGQISFKLKKLANGWIWSGVTISGDPHHYFETIPKAEQETNQPLPFGLLAPWDMETRRDRKSFMAGGLFDPEQNPYIPSPARWRFWLRFIPIVGDFIRAADAFLAPIGGTEGARRLRWASTACGFGLRGYYYNTSPTHTGSNAFAVDFTSFDGFTPASEFTSVLSAVGGRVIRAVHSNPNNGDDTNLVEVMTRSEDGTDYVARYLHLAREGRPPVLEGMSTYTGQLLGRMQDTGNSFFAHLHFSIHNQSLSHPDDRTVAGGSMPRGRSIRLRPFEDTALGDDDESSCIASSQGGELTARIVAPIAGSRTTQIDPVGLTAEISGGVHPIEITWSSNLEARNPIHTEYAREDRSNGNFYFFRTQGLHTITVLVEDAVGRSAQDTLNILVENSPATIEIVSPEAMERFSIDEAVILQGRSRDPETNRPLSDSNVRWELLETGELLSTGHSAAIASGRLSADRHSVRFIGQDTGTEIAMEREFEIVNEGAPARPFVAITEPSDGTVFWTDTINPDSGFQSARIRFVGSARAADRSRISDDNLVWHAENAEGERFELGTGSILVARLDVGSSGSARYNLYLTASDAGGQTRTVQVAVFINSLI